MVGRFQVMATLQAARAYKLGLSLDSAYSWGLDRALFYAVAKRGFKGKRHFIPNAQSAKAPIGVKQPVETPKPKYSMFYLGDEGAFMDNDKALFVFGDKTLTPQDFQRQIISRLKDFQSAWSEALNIVSQYSNEKLLSSKAFFEEIYKPRRDELALKWLQ